MALPTINDARFDVWRDADAGVWVCSISSGDPADEMRLIVHGIVTHTTPLKAMGRAVAIVAGREPVTSLTRLGEGETVAMTVTTDDP